MRVIIAPAKKMNPDRLQISVFIPAVFELIVVIDHSVCLPAAMQVSLHGFDGLSFSLPLK